MAENLQYENNQKVQTTYEFLQSALPNADPEYLRKICCTFSNDKKIINHFLSSALKNKNYPTKGEMERKKKLSEDILNYTSKFNIEDFLKIIPDPVKYFSGNNKTRSNYFHLLTNEEKFYIQKAFENLFQTTYIAEIRQVLFKNSYNIVKSVEILKKSTNVMKCKRRRQVLPKADNIKIIILQELAYVKHYDEIHRHFENKRILRQQQVEEAKKDGLLHTCECCYNEEVLPGEIVTCLVGHVFCRTCAKFGCEIQIEQGKTEFPCFTNCDSYFDLESLETFLDPKMYTNFYKNYQIEQIKLAGVTDIEFCVFCKFGAIPESDSKIFTCLNPDCRKETCRLCKEAAHPPFKCGEIETKDEVRVRSYIENKITDALVRTCYKCNARFLKEDGCNKMICVCGAVMCYICKQPVKDYSHFNGQGGDRHDLCPLFSNTNQIHEENVMNEVKKLQEYLDLEGVTLKHNPLKSIKKLKRKSLCKKKCSCCGK